MDNSLASRVFKHQNTKGYQWWLVTTKYYGDRGALCYTKTLKIIKAIDYNIWVQSIE